MAGPSGEFSVNLNDQASIEKLSVKLDRGPMGLLKSFGLILSRESKDAFAKQRFGSIKWPARYPDQTGAKLNVAGALMDLGKGPKIKERRFQDRPAAVDTGSLKNSIASSTDRESAGVYSVKVGTVLPYANTQHKGGVSRIAITQTMRVNYAKLWEKFKGFRAKARRGESSAIDRANAEIGMLALRRLSFLRNPVVSEYVVNVNARPFVGITAQALQDIQDRVRDWVIK
jgi:phage gpG-like protein